ncbi:hypothetical protein, partial [uncultured Dokdonia sp.]|uniref:leucine-rich repeat domain-containing protein n=1 Tax=uncultured Dokdonia sp. TaxID=575653 RepID=UPI00262941DB
MRNFTKCILICIASLFVSQGWGSLDTPISLKEELNTPTYSAVSDTIATTTNHEEEEEIAYCHPDYPAMVALYNNLNGANWNQPWNISECNPCNTASYPNVQCSAGRVWSINIVNDLNVTGTLPSEISQLTQLVFLSLNRTNVTGTLPTSMGSMTNLNTLNITRAFAGGLSGPIPASFANLTNLTWLSFSGHDLTGAIPSFIGNFSNLQTLNLGSNEFTGSIPPSIGNLSSLEFLDFRDNDLSGAIPTTFGNLNSIQYLYIFSNNLSGAIPTEIGNNTTMLEFWANNNQLTGTLPASLSNLTNLQQLNLNDNQISGGLPPTLGNNALPNLILLWLSNNQLSGGIPTSYGFFNSLQGMDIAENNLIGPIPTSFSSLSSILNITLQDNQLSGTIPLNAITQPSLTRVNISSNNFTGTLPPSLSAKTNLLSVQFNNNNFSGSVPNLTSNAGLSFFYIDTNAFQFGDFENEFPLYDANIALFRDNPQALLDTAYTQNSNAGDSVNMTVNCSGSQNTYQWYVAPDAVSAGTPITGATNATLTLTNVQAIDNGFYYALVNSNIVTDLTLERNRIELIVTGGISCTTLTSPTDMQTGVPISTDLTWDAVPNVTGYRLHVGSSAGNYNIINNLDVGNVTTYIFPTDLNEATTYFVQITPYSPSGDLTGCTEERFTTASVCTNLTNPIDGTIGVPVDTDLTWNPVSGAINYRLQVGSFSGNYNILDVIAPNTTYNFANDLNGLTNHYVLITPLDSSGTPLSVNCNEEFFRTDIECPTLLTPINGSIDVPVDTNLSWSSVPGAAEYNLLVGLFPGDFSVTNILTPGTGFNFPSDLDPFTTYYVSIIPYSFSGIPLSLNCSEESFTTGGACTNLISPVNGAVDVSVDIAGLEWNPVSGATTYQVLVGDASGNYNLINDTSPTSVYPFPLGILNAATTYYVQIIPYNSSGVPLGINCVEESFTTISSCTSLLNPFNGAVDVSVDIAGLEWNPVSGATTYQVLV